MPIVKCSKCGERIIKKDGYFYSFKKGYFHHECLDKDKDKKSK